MLSQSINWKCKHSWKISAKNTGICLLGCSIGDNATILFFQWNPHLHIPMMQIMILAMLIGLVTSILFETVVLSNYMTIKSAMRVAFGMSIISMLMMETSANVTSAILANENNLMLTWWSILPSWFVGYISALLYNYYNLKNYGKSCHG